MQTMPPALPRLTVNRRFMTAFVAAPTPCLALGVVEEGSSGVRSSRCAWIR